MAVGKACQLVARGPYQWADGNASGGRDGRVDGPPIVLGASRSVRSERGGKRWCTIFLSDCSSNYCIKYYELQHCPTLHSVGWTHNFCWSVLGLMSTSNLGKAVEACLKVDNCEDWLLWQVGASCILCCVKQYLMQFYLYIYLILLKPDKGEVNGHRCLCFKVY